MEAIAVASTVRISAPKQYGQQMFVMSYKPSVAIVRSNTHMIWASGTRQSEVARLRDKDSMLVEYLRGKGYGSLSLAEVEERQSQLGIFRSSNPSSLLQDTDTIRFLQPEKYDYNSLDFQANTEYLKEKGFGSMSLEEVMDLQQHLGIFGRPNGDEGMFRRDYGVEDISEDKGESELHGGFPSHVERVKLMTTGLGAANWPKTFQKGPRFKDMVTNHSKRSQSSIQPRSRWILDACFVIDLLQKPSNEKEKIATEACARTFKTIQAEGATVFLPEVCVAEASYFLKKQGVEYRLLDAILRGAVIIVSMEMGNWQRSKELFDLYASRHGMSIPLLFSIDCRDHEDYQLGHLGLSTFSAPRQTKAHRDVQHHSIESRSAFATNQRKFSS